jgi:hypothetical protein
MRTRHLCNSLLHKCRCVSTSRFWTKSGGPIKSPGTSIEATFEHRWSRALLVHQIESNLYSRQGTRKGADQLQGRAFRPAVPFGSTACPGPLLPRLPRAMKCRLWILANKLPRRKQRGIRKAKVGDLHAVSDIAFLGFSRTC